MGARRYKASLLLVLQTYLEDEAGFVYIRAYKRMVIRLFSFFVVVYEKQSSRF